jgi:transcriptional regulator with XRE-family HTH domain
MSPKQFKAIREGFGMTQDEFAVCLGLTQKAVSHYETGFRVPGSTVQVIVMALELLPPSQAKKLLGLMKDISEKRSRKLARSTS